MTRFLHSSYDAFQSVKFLERPDLMAQYAFEQLMNFSMRALGFSCFAAVLPASADSGIGSVSYPGGEGPGKGKHVVLVSGDEEYRTEEAFPMLGKMLAEKHGFKCTVLFPIDPKTGGSNGEPSSGRNSEPKRGCWVTVSEQSLDASSGQQNQNQRCYQASTREVGWWACTV